MRTCETFQQIYQAKTRTDFEQLLSKWDNWVSQCKLPAMVETSKPIKNPLERHCPMEIKQYQ